MSQEREAAMAGSNLADGVEAEALSEVVRHRRHHFPARDRVVKVRYDDREHAVLAAAADRADGRGVSWPAPVCRWPARDRLRPRRRTGAVKVGAAGLIGKVCQRGSDVRRLLGHLFRGRTAGEHGLSAPYTDAHPVAA